LPPTGVGRLTESEKMPSPALEKKNKGVKPKDVNIRTMSFDFFCVVRRSAKTV